MTIPETPERDPALSDAWREHSAESPPARLDAAILAAAHRAVGSVPQVAGRPAAGATSPQRWWMPLAAAATIGAVAIGVLQLAPPEHPDAAPGATSSVSDMVAAPSARTDKLTTMDRKDAPRAAPDAAAPQESATRAPDTSAPAPSPPSSSAPSSARAPAQPRSKVVAPSSAKDSASRPMAAAPQPFPAEKKSELDEAGRANELAAPAPSLAGTAPRTAPMAEPQRALAEAPSAPPPSATPLARGAASRDDLRQRSELAQSAPAATGTVGLAKTAPASDVAAKAVDVDAWIARIRKLHADGRLSDAAKELVALRAAVPDTDHRLPPELHAWAATVKP